MAISLFKGSKLTKTPQLNNRAHRYWALLADSQMREDGFAGFERMTELERNMVQFTAMIQQFGEQGEKTGWTYIAIPVAIAEQLQPGNRKSFRVKGKLDAHTISGVALLPMGGGSFILPLNGLMRKAIRKRKGAMLTASLSVDKQELVIPAGLLECLADAPEALIFFEQLKLSHRNYFIKWIGGVKSEAAVTKRMAQVVNAMVHKQDFAAMIRSHKAEKGGGGF